MSVKRKLHLTRFLRFPTKESIESEIKDHYVR